MILATNDDSAHAAGLAALVTALEATGADHVVFAEDVGWTGDGTALGFPRAAPVLVHAAPLAWRFRDATSALMVAATCSGLTDPRPYAVVVGVNRGPNIGGMTCFSGTVRAAVTASSFGAQSR